MSERRGEGEGWGKILFHIKEATVFHWLSADWFCRWSFKQQRKFKGSEQISAP